MSKKSIVYFVLGDLVSLLAMGAAVIWSAGRWDWWPAWLAVAVMAVNLTLEGFVTLRYHPGLLAERLTPPKSAKVWDRTLVSLLRLMQLALYILGGLDARHGWTVNFPMILQIVGAAACLLGYSLFCWALASNNYFSQVVRIQTDRGHTVATGGPYRFVRHPSYTGMILFELAMGVLLGSWWAILAGGLCGILLVIRTVLEDRTLQKELPGYMEYAQSVRYRLIPRIW